MTSPATKIRPGASADLPSLTGLYNRYIKDTPITFDTEPYADRNAWFEQFSLSGPHQLLVATVDDAVAGFACSTLFRPKAAYSTSVETTVYCDPDFTGRGLGSQLYEALFAALADEDVHRAYAGITLPNPASVALHERFDFHQIAVYSEVGRKFGRYWDVAWFEKNL